MTLNFYRITENHYHISVATWLGIYLGYNSP
ncbi:MAG: hypothetical protein ACI9LM_005374, partial [Alteromonadaceae bacterium]